MVNLLSVTLIVLLISPLNLFAQKWSVGIMGGANSSLKASYRNIQETGPFNYERGFPNKDNWSGYFPFSFGLEVSYKLTPKWSFISGINSKNCFYASQFTSFNDPPAKYSVADFRYRINSIEIPLGLSYRIIDNEAILLNLNLKANICFNKVNTYGIGSRILKEAADTTAFGVGVAHDFSLKRQFNIGNSIGFRISSNKILKRFFFQSEVHFQYLKGIAILQEAAYENLTTSKTEYYQSSFGLSPSFVSVNIGYLVYKQH